MAVRSSPSRLLAAQPPALGTGFNGGEGQVRSSAVPPSIDDNRSTAIGLSMPRMRSIVPWESASRELEPRFLSRSGQDTWLSSTSIFSAPLVRDMTCGRHGLRSAPPPPLFTTSLMSSLDVPLPTGGASGRGAPQARTFCRGSAGGTDVRLHQLLLRRRRTPAPQAVAVTAARRMRMHSGTTRRSGAHEGIRLAISPHYSTPIPRINNISPSATASATGPHQGTHQPWVATVRMAESVLHQRLCIIAFLIPRPAMCIRQPPPLFLTTAARIAASAHLRHLFNCCHPAPGRPASVLRMAARFIMGPFCSSLRPRCATHVPFALASSLGARGSPGTVLHPPPDITPLSTSSSRTRARTIGC